MVPGLMARLLIVEDNNALSSLLVSAVETRGHLAVARSTGQSALQTIATESFDVAIVDLLLPDLHGFEVLDRLAALKIPSFAMSGVYKGDAFATEAVEQHGARAFFEKPFDLDALIASIEEISGPAPSNGPGATEDPRQMLAGLPVVEAVEHTPPDAVELPFSQRDQVWRRESEEAGAPERDAVPHWAQGGSLAETPLPRLLNAFYEARHQGELKLKRGNLLKLVLFEDGRPIYAASNLAQERFARFCARLGLLTDSDMAAVAQLARESGVRTGDAMVQLGLIQPEQRAELLVQQVKSIIWSTFAWTEGSFSFEPHRSSRAGLVKLSVFPGDLILEGVLKSETLVTARTRMPSHRRLSPAPDPPYGLHEFKFTADQARLLAWADGTKRVEDLLTLSELSEREALATLCAYELLGLLEERLQPRSSGRISFGL